MRSLVVDLVQCVRPLFCAGNFMSLLNYSVYCKTARRCLLPWNIGPITPPNATFRVFFTANVAPLVQEPNRELEGTFVGSSKDKLDSVNCDMCVADVVSLFGPFVKFMVEEIGGACE